MVDIRLEMFSSPVMDSSYFPTCLSAMKQMKLLLMTQMKMFRAENEFVKIRTPGTCRPAQTLDRGVLALTFRQLVMDMMMTLRVDDLI